VPRLQLERVPTGGSAEDQPPKRKAHLAGLASVRLGRAAMADEVAVLLLGDR
jgi:hypothetical protein